MLLALSWAIASTYKLMGPYGCLTIRCKFSETPSAQLNDKDNNRELAYN